MKAGLRSKDIVAGIRGIKVLGIWFTKQNEDVSLGELGGAGEQQGQGIRIKKYRDKR